MSFFNIGKSGADGRQVRIEHRGHLLRASRTGGLALRAQTKAAGVNLTGNTSHGVRVSTTPVKDTQVAFQNGRFILRGRYGRGPTKLNLSKTGVTASTRNGIGTINWIKPKRSSAKIAGVQVRGTNALAVQSIYLAFSSLGWLAGALGQAARMLAALLVWLLGVIAWVMQAIPPATKELMRRVRNWRIRRQRNQLGETILDAFGQTSDEELKAAALLILAHWGRGDPVEGVENSEHPTSEMPSPRSAADEQEIDRIIPLLQLVERKGLNGDWHLACLAHVGELLSRRLPDQQRAELVLDIDDRLLQDGPKTVLQQRMLEVLADFARLSLVAAEEPDSNAQTTSADTTIQKGASPTYSPGAHPVNLNTASLEELQTLPHLGPERARALLAMRPLERVDELREIDGIGQVRLEEIRAFGVSI
jgi:DNA uptake protein ComE-like DNA-binding protein